MDLGLKLLAIEAEKSGVNFQELKRVVILPFYSFLDSVYELMRKYISNPHFQSWAQFLSIECNDRQISNIFGSWLKYSANSMQCRLLSMLLPVNSISKLKAFLRLRKEIIKTDQKMTKNIDNILLQHEDVIGIIHSVYSSVEFRRTLSEGIKSLFINYKMQQAKIYSCVFIQYVLTLHDTLQSRERSQATVQNQTGNYGRIPKSILCSSEPAAHPNKSVVSFKGKQIIEQNMGSSHQNNSNFQSALHDENGLYRKVRPQQFNFQKNEHMKSTLNQIQKSRIAGNKSIISVKRPKSRALLIAENQSYQKSRSSSPQKSVDRKQKQKKGLGINGKQQKFTKVYHTANAYHKGNSESRLIHEIEENQINNSKKEQSFKSFIKPLTYSERINSPYEEEDIANSTSKPNGDTFRQRQNIFERDSKKQVNWRSSLENPEQHKQQNQEKVKQMQGGYAMFKKLMQKNRTISQQILNNQFVKRRESLVIDDEGNVNFEFPESISAIHDSIVRHSKTDRWNVTPTK